jgi:hypothetical protein
MANWAPNSRAGTPEAGHGLGRIPSRWQRSRAWMFLPAFTLTLGLCCAGCGGASEPQLAGPPEGMGLAKPVPPPKPTRADAQGSAADKGNQAPATR